MNSQKKESKKSLKYKTLEQLGSGAYGTVFKAELRNGHQEHKDQPPYFALK